MAFHVTSQVDLSIDERAMDTFKFVADTDIKIICMHSSIVCLDALPCVRLSACLCVSAGQLFFELPLSFY